jgi:hypothetical protein
MTEASDKPARVEFCADVLESVESVESVEIVHTAAIEAPCCAA